LYAYVYIGFKSHWGVFATFVIQRSTYSCNGDPACRSPCLQISLPIWTHLHNRHHAHLVLRPTFLLGRPSRLYFCAPISQPPISQSQAIPTTPQKVPSLPIHHRIHRYPTSHNHTNLRNTKSEPIPSKPPRLRTSVDFGGGGRCEELVRGVIVVLCVM